MIILSLSPEWLNPKLTRAPATLVALFLLVFSADSSAFEQKDVEAIPHVGERAREGFVLYQHSSDHKAFAIAPGGAWYWVTEAVSEDQAEQQALNKCQSNTQQKCVLYALNDRIVFDANKWSSLWGPYVDKETAKKVPTGIKVGQRFPDLAMYDDKGKKKSLSEHEGSIVFLHFWGSWCPPCMREFPSLKKLHAMIDKKYSKDVEMVLMQLRESFDDSMKWVDRHGFSGMPLYDSGVKDSESTMLSLKDGSQINDRDIARVFPSTYVLDRNGVVIFSHHGSVTNWLDYVGFFDHAVRSTSGANVSIAKNKGASLKVN